MGTARSGEWEWGADCDGYYFNFPFFPFFFFLPCKKKLEIFRKRTSFVGTLLNFKFFLEPEGFLTFYISIMHSRLAPSLCSEEYHIYVSHLIGKVWREEIQ